MASLTASLNRNNCKGFLDLIPELIQEISSHILSSNDLRSARRATNDVLGRYVFTSPIISQQLDLANLRLVCRYFGQVLQRETLRSLVFNLHVKRWDSADKVVSLLDMLAQGGSPRSLQTQYLFIKCTDPIRNGTGYGHPWFDKRDLLQDEELRAKAEAIEWSISSNLVKAILSFHNLRAVRWDIDEANALVISVMNALSSLPSLEDLTLNLECENLQALGINKFHDLLSLVVAFSDFSSRLEDEVVDHIATAISQSPRLGHLSILQHAQPSLRSNDTSFERLVKKVPKHQSLQYLESLHIYLPDITRNIFTTVHHFKALRRLYIPGVKLIEAPNYNSDELLLWEALTTSKTWLEEITISYLSHPLLTYLASYSGIQRLRILLLHTPDEDDIEYGTVMRLTQAFVKEILPHHSLSLVLSSTITSADDLNDSDSEYSESRDFPLYKEGLLFESEKKQQTVPSVWNFEICSDGVFVGLPLLLECSTESIEYHAEMLKVALTGTLHPKQFYRCGTASRDYRRTHVWISTLEVLQEDVGRYPHSIDLDSRKYDIKRSDVKKDSYVYTLSRSET